MANQQSFQKLVQYLQGDYDFEKNIGTIPQEWKDFFKGAGVKPSYLRDRETRNIIVEKINQFLQAPNTKNISDAKSSYQLDEVTITKNFIRTQNGMAFIVKTSPKYVKGYWGPLSRVDAERYLSNQYPGAYIIRWSDNQKFYVLSFLDVNFGSVNHFGEIYMDQNTGSISVQDANGVTKLFFDLNDFSQTQIDYGTISYPIEMPDQILNSYLSKQRPPPPPKGTSSRNIPGPPPKTGPSSTGLTSSPSSRNIPGPPPKNGPTIPGPPPKTGVPPPPPKKNESFIQPTTTSKPPPGPPPRDRSTTSGVSTNQGKPPPPPPKNTLSKNQSSSVIDSILNEYNEKPPPIERDQPKPPPIERETPPPPIEREQPKPFDNEPKSRKPPPPPSQSKPPPIEREAPPPPIEREPPPPIEREPEPTQDETEIPVSTEVPEDLIASFVPPPPPMMMNTEKPSTSTSAPIEKKLKAQVAGYL